MTGVEGFDGYEIMEYLSMVWGISVPAKDLGQDCGMACKHVTGGELASYTQPRSGGSSVDRICLYLAEQSGTRWTPSCGSQHN